MSRRAALVALSLFFADQGHSAPEQRVIDGVSYRILRVPAPAVSILWQDKQGARLRTFPAAAKFVTAEGLTVDTLMNGGIFEPGGVPSGLLVQDGKELHPVNRRAGEGNFYLQPNGIFLIGSKGAAVVRTDEYPLQGVQVRCAVQSGPLLLRHGKTHPQFNASSTSSLHRNGVGVTTSGEVVLAITGPNSPKLPNLHEFAQLFRSLGCEDALFLDGVLSQMKSGAEVNQPSNEFGSIIAVTKARD